MLAEYHTLALSVCTSKGRITYVTTLWRDRVGPSLRTWDTLWLLVGLLLFQTLKNTINIYDSPTAVCVYLYVGIDPAQAVMWRDRVARAFGHPVVAGWPLSVSDRKDCCDALNLYSVRDHWFSPSGNTCRLKC